MIVQYTDPPISYEKVTNKRKMSQVHYHQQHELYYLVSGETKYFVGEEIFHLFPGDFIFVPKQVIHQTDSENCLHNERILMSFEDSIFDDETRPLLEMVSKCKLVRIPLSKAYLVRDLLTKLQIETNREDPYKETLMKLYILELLALLCRLRYDYTPQISESEKLINAIADYIRENYSQELTLSVLSKQFGLSESCLSRKFKAVSGFGLNEFITSVRIHNAERLLLQENLPVTHVAEMCGYSDSNYFAAVFKKIKGTTPVKYAKINLR